MKRKFDLLFISILTRLSMIWGCEVFLAYSSGIYNYHNYFTSLGKK